MEQPPRISIPFANPIGQQQTVLIVDDEDAILGCAMRLERAEFRVLKAKDSAEALQICTAHSGLIDALLTDLIQYLEDFELPQEKRTLTTMDMN